MTDRDWCDGANPDSLRRWVEAHAPARKRVLADCAMCRRLGPLIDPNLNRIVDSLERHADGEAAGINLEECRPVLDHLATLARERWHRTDQELAAAARRWDEACNPSSDSAPTAPLVAGAEWLLGRTARLEAATRSAAVQAVSDAVVAGLCGQSAILGLFMIAYETAERQAEAAAMTDFALNWERRADELSEQFGRHPRKKGEIAVEAQEWADRGITMLESVTQRSIREARARSEREFVRTLHDQFGKPFRPVPFDPRWRTADVVGLARAIYEERAFERMPILADALMDAGCADEAVIAHCREAGPHYRGCWVADAVLEMARDAVAIRS